MAVNYKELQKRLFNRVHRTGEEIKNDFPNVLQACIDHKAWEHFTTVDGKPFKNLGEWLVYAFPNGVSMGASWSAVSYEDALQLCKDHRELHGLLVKHRPSPSGEKGGRPKKETVNNINGLPKKHVGTSRAYIEQRLQRDHPEIWKEYLSGQYKSARQAGIAAGILKKPSHNDTALKAFKRSQDRVGLLRDILSVSVAEGGQQALYEVQAAVEGLQKESPKKKATKGVRIDSGPLDATDKFEQVPKDKWFFLMLAKRDFLSTNLAYDCRCLVEFCEEAELAYADCGFNSAAEMIQQGYELDATKIELAIALLKSINRDVDRDVDTQTVEEIARSIRSEK